MKILSIVGARPQFIKAAPVSRAIEKHNRGCGDPPIREILVHTGQHYDNNMSQVFFDELEIRKPDYDLGVGSGSHGKMTGMMLSRIEEVLLKVKPRAVLVYGDTNSTLAGALATAKLHVLVVHIEAGLRSFNRRMPEELNRVVADHLSDILFCPTQKAVDNLRKENVISGVFMVGDVMYDAFLFNRGIAEKGSRILQRFNLDPGQYCLATVHRAENTDDPTKLISIFNGLSELSGPKCPFIVPVHPRTRGILEKMENANRFGSYVRLVPPVSYLDMIRLEASSKVILTDSGGVQKEAYFAGVPCITLREETEWSELVEYGFNVLAGHDFSSICRAFDEMSEKALPAITDLYGTGQAAEDIVDITMKHCCLPEISE